MQIGFFFDQSRCIGCQNCVAVCRSRNQLGLEMPDIAQITSKEEGEFPDVSLSHLFVTCFHCSEPACISACPCGVLRKRDQDGVVFVADPESCSGCESCVETCPYGAIKVVNGDSVTILKCDLCLDRLDEGKPPACVSACPTAALEVGPMEVLLARSGGLRELDGLVRSEEIKPSVVFVPRLKRDAYAWPGHPCREKGCQSRPD